MVMTPERMLEVRTPHCPRCGIDAFINVDFMGHVWWNNGEKEAEEAFPDMTEEEIRLLTTGWHEHCWQRWLQEVDEMFGGY